MKKNEQVIVRRKVWLQAVAPAVLFCALALQLCIRLEIIKGGYQVQYLRKSFLEQDNRLRQLRFQHASLIRPGKISRDAKNKLALSSIRPEHMRRVSLAKVQNSIKIVKLNKKVSDGV